MTKTEDNKERVQDDQEPPCYCNGCLDEQNPTRQRSGEWAGVGIMTNDIGPLP